MIALIAFAYGFRTYRTLSRSGTMCCPARQAPSRPLIWWLSRRPEGRLGAVQGIAYLRPCSPSASLVWAARATARLGSSRRRCSNSRSSGDCLG